MRIAKVTLLILHAFCICSCLPQGKSASFGSFAGIEKAENLDGSRVAVTWIEPANKSAVSSYQIYEIQNDGTLGAVGFAKAPATQYIVSGLTPGTLHTYLVRATDTQGTQDQNLGLATALTYSGVTSVDQITTTSAVLTFPAAGQASGLKILCGPNASSLAVVATVAGSVTSYNLHNSSTLSAMFVELLR